MYPGTNIYIGKADTSPYPAKQDFPNQSQLAVRPEPPKRCEKHMLQSGVSLRRNTPNHIHRHALGAIFWDWNGLRKLVWGRKFIKPKVGLNSCFTLRWAPFRGPWTCGERYRDDASSCPSPQNVLPTDMGVARISKKRATSKFITGFHANSSLYKITIQFLCKTLNYK